MNEAIELLCQRRSVRRHVRIEGEVVSMRDFSIAARRILDLSEDGLRFESERPPRVGDRVLASFALTTGDTEIWVDVEGTIAHVTEETAGVAFDALDDFTRALLRNRLRAIPPVVPRRESGTFLRL